MKNDKQAIENMTEGKQQVELSEFVTKEEAEKIAVETWPLCSDFYKDMVYRAINLAIAQKFEVVGKVTDADGFTGAPFVRFIQNPKIGTPLYALKTSEQVLRNKGDSK